LVLRVRIHESFWASLFLAVCVCSLFAVLVVFLGLDAAARGEQQEVVTTTRFVPSISLLYSVVENLDWYNSYLPVAVAAAA
jgi:hypothetical protein